MDNARKFAVPSTDLYPLSFKKYQLVLSNRLQEIKTDLFNTGCKREDPLEISQESLGGGFAPPPPIASPLPRLHTQCRRVLSYIKVTAGMIPAVTVTDRYVIIRHQDLAARLEIFHCVKYF